MKASVTGFRAIELRNSNRYRFNAPVIFRWALQDWPTGSSIGVTRDISTSGVYVVTTALPPVGAKVQMEILLPRLVQAGQGIHLTGEGVVLRSEPCGSKSKSEGGFAAAVHFFPEPSEWSLQQSERVP